MHFFPQCSDVQAKLHSAVKLVSTWRSSVHKHTWNEDNFHIDLAKPESLMLRYRAKEDSYDVILIIVGVSSVWLANFMTSVNSND